jgi:hypothetical protein
VLVPFIGRGGSSPPPDTATRAKAPDSRAFARRVPPVKPAKAPPVGFWPDSPLDSFPPVPMGAAASAVRQAQRGAGFCHPFTPPLASARDGWQVRVGTAVLLSRPIVV